MAAYDNDYIERMIKALGKTLTVLLAGRSILEEEEEQAPAETVLTEDDLLGIMIRKYISEGEINKAENMLLEAIETDPSQYHLDLALYFYSEVNHYNDETLLRYQYSREEIKEGLEWIEKLYHMELKPEILLA